MSFEIICPVCNARWCEHIAKYHADHTPTERTTMPSPNYDNLQTEAERRQVDAAVDTILGRLPDAFGLERPRMPNVIQVESMIAIRDELRELVACKLKAGRMAFELEQIAADPAFRTSYRQKQKRRDIAARASAYADLKGRINAHGIKLITWTR